MQRRHSVCLSDIPPEPYPHETSHEGSGEDPGKEATLSVFAMRSVSTPDIPLPSSRTGTVVPESAEPASDYLQPRAISKKKRKKNKKKEKSVSHGRGENPASTNGHTNGHANENEDGLQRFLKSQFVGRVPSNYSSTGAGYVPSEATTEHTVRVSSIPSDRAQDIHHVKTALNGHGHRNVAVCPEHGRALCRFSPGCCVHRPVECDYCPLPRSCCCVHHAGDCCYCVFQDSSSQRPVDSSVDTSIGTSVDTTVRGSPQGSVQGSAQGGPVQAEVYKPESYVHHIDNQTQAETQAQAQAHYQAQAQALYQAQLQAHYQAQLQAHYQPQGHAQHPVQNEGHYQVHQARYQAPGHAQGQSHGQAIGQLNGQAHYPVQEQTHYQAQHLAAGHAQGLTQELTHGQGHHHAQGQAQEQVHYDAQVHSQGQMEDQAQNEGHYQAQNLAEDHTHSQAQSDVQGQVQSQSQDEGHYQAEQTEDHSQNNQGQTEEKAQNHVQDQTEDHDQNHEQDYAQSQVQGQAEDRSQDQVKDQVEDQAEGQVQDEDQAQNLADDYVHGHAQDHAQTHTQDRAQSQVQGQVRDHAQGQVENQAEGQAQDYGHNQAQHQAQDLAEDHVQGQVQGRAEDQTKDHALGQNQAQGHAQEHAGEHTQDHSQSHVQGRDEGQSQHQSQHQSQISDQINDQNHAQNHAQGHAQGQTKSQVEHQAKEKAQDQNQAKGQSQHQAHGQAKGQSQDQDQDQDEDQAKNSSRALTAYTLKLLETSKYSDCRLVIKMPMSHFHPIPFPTHKVILSRTPRFATILDANVNAGDIDATTGDTFSMIKAFETALQNLYGLPYLTSATLKGATAEALGYEGVVDEIETLLPVAFPIRAAMADYTLCYIASGVFLGDTGVVETGVRLAIQIAHSDNLELLLSFALRPGRLLFRSPAATVTAEAATAAAVKDVRLDMHLAALVRIALTRLFEPLVSPFNLYISAQPDRTATFPDRIPVALRAYPGSILENPKLAEVKFGSFASVAELRPSPEVERASGVLLALSFDALKIAFGVLDEHGLLTEEVAKAVVIEREARRFYALRVYAMFKARCDKEGKQFGKKRIKKLKRENGIKDEEIRTLGYRESFVMEEKKVSLVKEWVGLEAP